MNVLFICRGGLTRAPSSSSSLGQTQSSSYRNPQSVPPSPQRAAVPRGHSSSSLTNNGSFSGSLGGIASGTPRMGRGPSIPRTNSNMTPMGMESTFFHHLHLSNRNPSK